MPIVEFASVMALCGMAAMLVVQAWFTIAFLMLRLRRRNDRGWAPRIDDRDADHSDPGDSDLDAAAMIVICLRGADPYLSKTLGAATRLNHSNYFIKVIIDHETDPARDVVADVIRQTGSNLIQAEVLRERYVTCSLKCNSLVQALSNIPDDVQFVALMDADIVPHPEWLSELLRPLAADPSIGVTTGNRWYIPRRALFGSIVRCIWNAGAVTQMGMLGIPWGGTLAFRTALVRELDLNERLKNAFCEDTMLQRAAAESNQNVQFVDDLLMVNREDCRIPGLLSWISRQLLTVRLYHGAWPVVYATGLLTLFVWGLTGICAVVALATGSLAPLLWLVVGGILTLSQLTAGVIWTDFIVRLKFKRIGRPEPPWMTPATLCSLALGMCALQVIYPLALIRAARLRVVTWRGVNYDIRRDGTIRMLQYVPFRRRAQDVAVTVDESWAPSRDAESIQ